MTESEWSETTDPVAMLEHLKGWASERKLRLFACACCRRIWHLNELPEARDTVDLVERFADGASVDDLYSVQVRLIQAIPKGDERYERGTQWNAVLCAVLCAAWNDKDSESAGLEGPIQVARSVATAVARGEANEGEAEYAAALASEHAATCVALRDSFDPFRRDAVSPAWLAWNGGTVPDLARAAYTERSLPSGELDRDKLFVLADALEEAGCSNPAVLDHLRGPGPHWRGCWAVDLCLGLY